MPDITHLIEDLETATTDFEISGGREPLIKCLKTIQDALERLNNPP
jgi:hypothetical protein